MKCLKLRYHYNAVDNEIYSNKTMASHLNELDKRFIRCHSSIIVNMQYIKKYSHNEVELDAGERLPISKSRRKEFLEKFKSYLKITFER
ncbi:LytTR family transcriptional regulator DNA-binding domain-containing protein [Mediterraneibacter gnavus]|uniref:LytTR family transcriptional regulator DNA-binding domain-containing protein n=1 Tax=Mediterraneibacter gnavus TaxID=33038 RepID=UPI0036D3B2F7